MTNFTKMTVAQLDGYAAEHDLAIAGWSKMKVAAKRAFLAAPGRTVIDDEPALNAPVKFRVGKESVKIAAHGPLNIDDLEDAPKETVTIKITDAQSNPVMLFVHGVGSWEIRIGETVTLPVEAVSALENSDVKFDEV